MSRPPRLGFLGLGWIGQHRMQALLAENACEVAVIAGAEPVRVDVGAATVEVDPAPIFDRIR